MIPQSPTKTAATLPSPTGLLPPVMQTPPSPTVFVPIAVLDLDKLPVKKTNLTPRQPRPKTGARKTRVTRRDSQPITNAAKEKIGFQGEELVYGKLKLDYCKKKYPACQLTETTLGFSLIGKDQQGNDLNLEVIWYNKNATPLTGYSQRNKDLVIIKNGVKRIIEVKSTLSPDKDTFDISHREFMAAKKYAEKYRIFRVFNTGSISPRIEIIKNPAEKIQSQCIEVLSYKIKLGRNTPAAQD